MSDRRTYSYTVLRYVHDLLTGEFINVGVVIYVPSLSLVKVKTRPTIGRIKNAFPDLRRTAFTSAMKSIARGLRTVAKQHADKQLLSSEMDAGSVARLALPADDSSLQWSPVGGGVTDDVDRTVERLYERLVGRYDSPSHHRRTDEDIWRPVREKIAERKVPVQLEEKILVGATDEIVFKHAWKNGKWQAYEPISLDMADAEGIKDKARRWLGHLSAVADADEKVKLHLVVGLPQDQSLMTAFDSALAILGKAPFEPSIYREDQVEELVNQIEDQVQAAHR
jgi:hypothetical protein